MKTAFQSLRVQIQQQQWPPPRYHLLLPEWIWLERPLAMLQRIWMVRPICTKRLCQTRWMWLKSFSIMTSWGTKLRLSSGIRQPIWPRWFKANLSWVGLLKNSSIEIRILSILTSSNDCTSWTTLDLIVQNRWTSLERPLPLPYSLAWQMSKMRMVTTCPMFLRTFILDKTCLLIRGSSPFITGMMSLSNTCMPSRSLYHNLPVCSQRSIHILMNATSGFVRI